MDKSFFSSREIYVRLASKFRRKMSEYDPQTIMRWCAEVNTEFIKDNSGMVERTINLGIPNNNMLGIPYNVFKIERVFVTDSTSLVEYSHQGSYLLFNEKYNNTAISLYAKCYLTDDDGFPLIKRGYEKACEAFCVYQMYNEDFLEGKIDATRWQDINNTKDWEIEAAARAWDEVNDNFMKDMLDINTSMASKAQGNG